MIATMKILRPNGMYTVSWPEGRQECYEEVEVPVTPAPVSTAALIVDGVNRYLDSSLASLNATMKMAHTRDVLLDQYGRKRKGERPTVLPKMSRTQLPTLCRLLGFTNGAEIGVWRGAYAATFCEAGMHMLCVDPWLSYPAWQDTKNSLEPDAQAAFMAEANTDACQRLGPLNATIVRTFSADASRDVPDGSLDLVYIDSNHVFDAVIEDLTLWAPKVRSGGIVSGHDFRTFANKPTIHVVEAVNAYTKAHAIDPWFVLAGDRTPSFMWVVR